MCGADYFISNGLSAVTQTEGELLGRSSKSRPIQSTEPTTTTSYKNTFDRKVSSFCHLLVVRFSTTDSLIAVSFFAFVSEFLLT